MEGLPWQSNVKTSCFQWGRCGLIHGQGTKIPHALQPKSQNIKHKQHCNKFNTDFKNSPTPKKKNLNTSHTGLKDTLWPYLLTLTWLPLKTIFSSKDTFWGTTGWTSNIILQGYNLTHYIWLNNSLYYKNSVISSTVLIFLTRHWFWVHLSFFIHFPWVLRRPLNM